jgi:methyl-accepting chemotaxis protein
MQPNTSTRRSDSSTLARWRHQFREALGYIPSGESIPEEMWRSRHRKILVSLVAHIPFLLALGLYEGTESRFTGATIPSIPTWLVVGQLAFVGVVALLASWSRLGRRTRTALGSFGLMTTSTLLVRFSGGYIEAHFHFFVVGGVIALYEDWLPFVVALVYVAAGHVAFSLIDPSNVYNHAAAIQYPWAWAVIHAVFVLALSGALITNWYSIERSREESEARLREVAERTSQIETVEAAKAEADARRDEVERLNDHLETKADAYSATMRRAADGDLTVRLDTASESEAMTQIGDAFNEMLDEIDSTMQEIQAFSRAVTAASDGTVSEVQTAEDASERVSRSVHEIVADADDQRLMLEEVVGEVNSLSATIEEIASSTQTVATTASATADVAATSETTADDAIDRMEDVRATVDSTVENVRSLKDQMDEIGEIVDLIGSVADQTNLLALNASIEAARAGRSAEGNTDHGFSVVADEIKQLAGETRQAATDIEQLIGDAQARTEATVEEVRTADDDLQRGMTAVRDVSEALSSVADNTDETDSEIQEISAATDNQATSMEEAVSMIEPVTEISRATAEKAEQMSSTAAEQVAATSRVSTEAESLSTQADELRQLLAQFEVGGSRRDTERRTVPRAGVSLD